MLSFYLLGAKKIFSFLKKVFFVITVYFVIIALFFRFTSNNQIKNQVSVEEKIRKYNYQLINDKKIKDNPSGKTIIGVYRAFSCFSFGELCTDKPDDWKKNQQNSLFGKINNLFISTIFTPPASFLYWSYNSLEKANFIPQTHAQTTTAYTGIGLRSIQAFYKLWENIRNLSFLIITLVLVGIGFMIMFRTKINPQTIISVENALPKIIISMILITFSYPIAGLMIDIMYISLPIISGLFNNIIDSNTNQFLFDQFINKSAFSVVFDKDFFGIYWSALWQILSGGFITQSFFWRNIIFLVFSFIMGLLVGLIYTPIGNWFVDMLGDIKGTATAFTILGLEINIAKGFVFLIVTALIILIIPFLIIVIGLLFLSFRIFFFLLSCLFNLIIYIVLAPLYLLLEAIPGKNSFSSWIKNIIGNLAVFPAFLFIILLIRAINNSIILEPQKFFSLPGLTNDTNISTFLASMINIYILLMIPDLLKLVKATIIGKEGLSAPVSAGILFGGVGATLGTVTGFANQFYYLKMGYDTFFGKKQPHAAQTGRQETEPEKNQFREWISSKIFRKK